MEQQSRNAFSPNDCVPLVGACGLEDGGARRRCQAKNTRKLALMESRRWRPDGLDCLERCKFHFFVPREFLVLLL